MVAVLALTGAALFLVAGLALAARMVHIGNLDAVALAQKLATPYPSSAADWPELQIQAVVPQPNEPAVVLLLVSRPRYDGHLATLLVQLDGTGERSVRVLSGWRSAGCSIAPTRQEGSEVELRRRQSLERVRGRLLAEDVTTAA